MPELPEVQTIVSQLQKTVPNLTIRDVWSDWIKMLQVVSHNDHIKIPKSEPLKKGKRANKVFDAFAKDVIGKKIIGAKRVGKNIIIELSENHAILIHQKMSGHLLFGEWDIIDGVAVPKEDGVLKEKINGYIHFILYLSKGKMLALSDLRKFAKIISGPKEKILSLPELKMLGPDALSDKLNFSEFKKRISSKRLKIKQVLLDQSVISGIGNIYADEMLWYAKIHPETPANKIDDARLKKMYNAMRRILRFSIKIGGDSMSDFRNLFGKRGGFQNHHKVYQREGESCFSCKTKIKRVKVSGRSSHFCPKCQKV